MPTLENTIKLPLDATLAEIMPAAGAAMRRRLVGLHWAGGDATSSVSGWGDLLAVERLTVLAALRKGLPVATASYLWDLGHADPADDALCLLQVMVAPKLRGRGLSRRLYQQVLADFRFSGLPQITARVDVGDVASANWLKALGLFCVGETASGRHYRFEFLRPRFWR